MTQPKTIWDPRRGGRMPLVAVASLLIAGALTSRPSAGPGSRFGRLLSPAEAQVHERYGRYTLVVEQARTPRPPPEEVARDFYRWYLNALYSSPNADPLKDQKAEAGAYLTARLLQELANARRTSTVRKGPDVDIEYFFQTLDLDSDWKQGVTAPNSANKDGSVVVQVTLSGRGDSRQELKAVLKSENGVWKIDHVGPWRK